MFPSLSSSGTSSLTGKALDVTDYVTGTESFRCKPFTFTEVPEALVKMDVRKPAGPDNVDAYFLNVIADLITIPLTHIYNLTLVTNEILKLWKGGNASSVSNKRPISNMSAS